MNSFSTHDRPGRWPSCFLHCPRGDWGPECSVTCPQALPKSKEPGYPRAAWLESPCPQCYTAHRACAVVGKRSFLVLGKEWALLKGRETGFLVCRHINQEWQSKDNHFMITAWQSHTWPLFLISVWLYLFKLLWHRGLSLLKRRVL